VSEQRRSARAVPDAEQLYRRLLQEESVRLETRRRELEDAQEVIAGFADRHERLAEAEGIEPLTVDVVPRRRAIAAYEDGIRSTTGPIRNAMRSIDTAPMRDDAFVRWGRGQVAQGRPLRTVYPAEFLQTERHLELAWMRSWADVGEQQRVLDQVPHSFVVFGDQLVLAGSRWGVATEDLVAVRAPMLVQAFVSIFDAVWHAALPVPTLRDQSEDRLLALLAAGFKDEAIARYLGVSLRTVRRRVALLMESLGAHTRFALGTAAERRGLVGTERD
jgi:DNA-binding CsgD family transcriptional regulator